MPTRWNDDALQTAVDFRTRPGENWNLLDIDAQVDAPSGGGRNSTAIWGRGELGGLTPRGRYFTDNPHDFKANVSMRLTGYNFLKRFEDCPLDIRVRQKCDQPQDTLNYGNPGIISLLESTNGDTSYSDPLALMDGQAKDVKIQTARMATQRGLYTKVVLDDVSTQQNDVDFVDVISTSVRRCAGDCGTELTEENGFWAVTKKDSTPLYAANATPWFYYTTDGAVTWTSVRIDTLQAADPTQVLMVGGNVVVLSTNKAPAYAKYADIVNGVTAPNLWSVMTGGFTGLVSPNFPKVGVAINSNIIFMAGNGGRIWKSTDGGISCTLLDNGTTTSNNLNSICAQSEDLVYIGGNSGTLVRIQRGSIAVVQVKDVSNNILSSNINVVGTPPTRSAEVYMGTAGGEIWRTRNATDVKVVSENLKFPRTGQGSIVDIDFAGYRGDVMFVVQSDANGYSRLLRDFSGGAMGTDVEIIGDFQTPGNFGFNSIDAVNANFAMVVGPVHNTYGFIGKLHSAAI